MAKIPLRHVDGIKIVRVEHFFTGKETVQPLHRHSFYYILALRKASGEHSIDFEPYPVTDSSVFLLRPGQVHQLTLKEGSTGYLIQIAEDFYPTLQRSAGQLFRRSGQRNLCALDAARSKKLFSILAGVLEEYNARQERYQEVIRAGLEVFFIELLRQCPLPPASALSPTSAPTSASPNPPAPAPPPAPMNGIATKNIAANNIATDNVGGYMQERLESLLALIERHIATHKEVAYYAGKLRLTSYQLNATTKATLGKTCSEVIDAHVVLEAKRHLLATTNQVKQIAGDLGYEDVSYFIRFFRKHTGYSPESLRQRFG